MQNMKKTVIIYGNKGTGLCFLTCEWGKGTTLGTAGTWLKKTIFVLKNRAQSFYSRSIFFVRGYAAHLAQPPWGYSFAGWFPTNRPLSSLLQFLSPRMATQEDFYLGIRAMKSTPASAEASRNRCKTTTQYLLGRCSMGDPSNPGGRPSHTHHHHTEASGPRHREQVVPSYK